MSTSQLCVTSLFLLLSKNTWGKGLFINEDLQEQVNLNFQVRMYHLETSRVILSIVHHHVYIDEEKKGQLYKVVEGRWVFQSQTCVLPYHHCLNLSGKWGKASEASRKKLVKITKNSNFSSFNSIESLISLSTGDKRNIEAQPCL